MSNEKEVKKATLRDLRENLGLVSKLTSYLGYPILIFNRFPSHTTINKY